MVPHEFGHLIGRVEHALPVVAVAVRFVLHGEAPQGNTLRFASLGVLDEELRPRRLHLRQKPPADPVAVVLHPRRGGPRGGDDLEAVLGDGLGRLDHREQELAVLLHGEVVQRQVAFHGGRAVVEAREIARVHVRSSEAVVGARLGEVGLEDALALFRTHLVDEVGRGVGEGSAKSFDGLLPLVGVHADADVFCSRCVQSVPLLDRVLGQRVEPSTAAGGLVDRFLAFSVRHACGSVAVEKGLDHGESFLGGSVDVHESPVFFVGGTVVRDAIAGRGPAADVLLIRFSGLPPSIGEGEDRHAGRGDRIGEEGGQEGVRRSRLGVLVWAWVKAGCSPLHVAVRTQLGEVEGFVAFFGEFQCGGVRDVPPVHVHSPQVDVGHVGEQGFIRDFAVGRGDGVVGVFRLNGGGRGLQRFVPHVEGSVEPLGVVVVLVAELPTQDGGVGLELPDVVEVGARLQVEDAALIVPETGNDRDAGGVDLVEHRGGGDGLVDPDGVDAQVLHEGEVLRQRCKAAQLLADGDGVVADALDEVGAVFREELTLVGPDPGSRFRAGGQDKAEEQGGRGKEGKLRHEDQVRAWGQGRGGPACRAVRRSCA